ncbi:acylphosphatase [Lacticaseibacillus pabuli]|uniref:acylphosphatase n=1 Tax=Lacticaseibacillus pabuli TaxID=3025672 RepID=A0ABY7WX46_9LACO|nr:acylphosphatase [Lacticaseibacillus sp. KACC 23028]WDF83571.1 acylphosphatase [Lacticaseibacillus sp. KACC 23028]
MNEVAYQIRVTGLVQGVGFRWTTKMLADQLHIRGTVANKADGSVEIFALGSEYEMNRFRKGIKDSPTPAGRVSVYEDHQLDPLPTYDGFNVVG